MCVRPLLTQIACTEPSNFCFIEVCLLESSRSEMGCVGSRRTRSSRGPFPWLIAFATSENKRQSARSVIWMCRGSAVHSYVFLRLKSPLVPDILSPRRYLRPLFIVPRSSRCAARQSRLESPGFGRRGMWPCSQPTALAADEAAADTDPAPEPTL